MAENNYAIQLKGITKTFGSVVANNNVDLDLKQGEILALLGENGSGKTTLMNMLSGIYRPDKGQIFIDGQKVYIDSPEDSKRLGIGMVHQHFKLIEKFSVADNIWLGYHEPGDKIDLSGEQNKFKRVLKTCANGVKNFFKKSFLKKSRYNLIADFAKEYGFELDPQKRICDMAVSEKQTVEIVKVLFYGAKVLILDEPTAVLTEQEIQKLFAILRKMKEKGCSIIIITHKLNEVLAISDRVSILRKGEYIGTVNTADTNESQLTEMMVGKKVDLHIDRPKTNYDEDMLIVDNIVVNNSLNIKAIDNVSFKVRRGEILGVAGISGSGQKELCEAIAGLEKIKSGSIDFMGKKISGMSPLEIIKLGITMSFIPEDRLGMGLAGTLNITDNMMLKTYRNNKFNPFVDRKQAGAMAKDIVEKLDVKTPDTDKTPVRRLSGGNVQKVLLGREIEMTPQVIITAYPVRGLDINSSYMIYDILNKQKQDGVGILFVGEDLDVMLQLCDKIMVLCHGRVTGIVDASKVIKEQIGWMMTGAFASQVLKDTPDAIIEDGQGQVENISNIQQNENDILPESQDSQENTVNIEEDSDNENTSKTQDFENVYSRKEDNNLIPEQEEVSEIKIEETQTQESEVVQEKQDVETDQKEKAEKKTNKSASTSKKTTSTTKKTGTAKKSSASANKTTSAKKTTTGAKSSTAKKSTANSTKYSTAKAKSSKSTTAKKSTSTKKDANKTLTEEVNNG